MKKKILLTFGTRPEAIKMAPLVKSLDDSFEVSVCVTGQHRQMLDQVLELFEIVPNSDLNIMKDGQDLFDITSNIISKFKSALEEFKPDLVLVHGDTTTSVVCALSAFYKKIPVGHIEAGLRTKNIYSPFPEEMNRQITSRIASFHFAPTNQAKKNLLDEGVDKKKIFVTGNTIVDSLEMIREKAKAQEFPQAILEDLPFLKNNEYQDIILITGHRRENFGEGFKQICLGLKDIAIEFKDHKLVYPLHLNPNVVGPANSILGGIENIYLIKPVEYLVFIKLMQVAKLVITDSGGIQEEAPSFSLPVLVMRDTTERPEAIESGCAKLVGPNRDSIFQNTKEILCNDQKYSKMISSSNPYGDGEASRIIKEILLKNL